MGQENVTLGQPPWGRIFSGQVTASYRLGLFFCGSVLSKGHESAPVDAKHEGDQTVPVC